MHPCVLIVVVEDATEYVYADHRAARQGRPSASNVLSAPRRGRVYPAKTRSERENEGVWCIDRGKTDLMVRPLYLRDPVCVL